MEEDRIWVREKCDGENNLAHGFINGGEVYGFGLF